MNSTSTSHTDNGATRCPTLAVLRWRCWPLAEHVRWSWVMLVGLVAMGGIVGYAAGSLLWGAAATAGLAITLWQFLLPVYYEINPAGYSRQVLGRGLLVPWHAVRSYQARVTGIVLFRRADPAAIDALGCWFVPYAADKDEMLCAVRQYLQHAVELPA